MKYFALKVPLLLFAGPKTKQLCKRVGSFQPIRAFWNYFN